MEKYIRYTLIVLVVILAVLLVFLFLQYRSLARQQSLGILHFRWALFLERNAPLPAREAAIIRPWMTFDYVNKLFALPPDYLKTRFTIAASSSYPRLTISGYAKGQGLDATAFLGNVENAIASYK